MQTIFHLLTSVITIYIYPSTHTSTYPIPLSHYNISKHIHPCGRTRTLQETRVRDLHRGFAGRPVLTPETSEVANGNSLGPFREIVFVLLEFSIFTRASLQEITTLSMEIVFVLLEFSIFTRASLQEITTLSMLIDKMMKKQVRVD
ncbi:hypothetical protein HanIR_Chr17g0858371 [Helianthus annuus]|nr:hypothetical protein HanIR_Chr17g0858371 [Helianthus annuus]